MAIFKVAKCAACGRKLNTTQKAEVCPRCGREMRLSTNWYISFTQAGRKYIKAIGPQRRMAEDALGKIRVEIREGRFFDKAPSTTWDKAVEAFRRHFRAHCSPKTCLMYEASLKTLSARFRAFTLDKISPQMIEAFIAERLDGGVTNSTVNRDLAALRRMFTLAEEWGLVEKNPMRHIRKLKENPPRTRHLTQEEVNRLIDACNQEWLKLAILIAVETGLRKSAIFGLKRQDIDFQSAVIRVRSKGNKMITVPLTKLVQAALHRRIEELSREKVVSQYIFPSPVDASKPIRSDYDKGFKAACRRAGIKDLRFHDLRHTFASLFYERTGDWKALQEILGHSDISTTMKVYTHLREEHLRQAISRFEQHRTTDSL